MAVECTCVFGGVGSLKETELVAQRGNDNFFDFDILNNDLDVADLLWFRVATKQDFLTDADAEFVKTRSGGIADVDAPNGIFQVQLEPGDVATLEDGAYVFHCVIRKADANMDTTLARGVMRLTGP